MTATSCRFCNEEGRCHHPEMPEAFGARLKCSFIDFEGGGSWKAIRSLDSHVKCDHAERRGA